MKLADLKHYFWSHTKFYYWSGY